MRGIVPLEQKRLIINGVMIDLDKVSPLSANVFEADEQTLIAILESGVKVLVLDQDAESIINSDLKLGFSSPNMMEVQGSPTITLPAIPSGNAQAFNGLQWIFKYTGTGTATLSGAIDGGSSFSIATTNEAVTIKIINGKYCVI